MHQISIFSGLVRDTFFLVEEWIMMRIIKIALKERSFNEHVCRQN